METIVSSRVLTTPEKLTPLTEIPSDCNILTPFSPPLPRVMLLQVGGNSYYHSPFPNKNMAHSLTYSLTDWLID